MENFHNFSRRGTTITGAIFMTNRRTKQECLHRKLFGLPLQMNWFIEKVKAGMLLFLFEYEERKLYGVFEATCDGAMNIVPSAYISSGKTFPAQILFKRVWMCKPLCEDEFRDAIKDNYYAPNKFYYGLSYEQVIELVHLFFLKRINLQQHTSKGKTHQIIKQFEKCSGKRVTGQGSSLRLYSDGYSLNDCTDSQSYRDISESDTNIPKNPPSPVCYHPSSFVGPCFPTSNVGLPSKESCEDHPNFSDHETVSFADRYHPPSTFVEPSFATCNPSNVGLPSQETCEDHPNSNDYELVSFTDRYDPSSRTISFWPEMTLTNYAEFSQSPTGQLCGGLAPPSELLSLSSTNCLSENVESAHLNMTQKDKPGSYFSESIEDDDSDDIKPSRLRSDMEHGRTSVFSRLAKNPETFKTMGAGVKNERYRKPGSNTKQSKTNVFSRLDSTSETWHVKEISESGVKNERAQNPVTSLSLDEVLSILSQRREQLNAMTEVPIHSIQPDTNVDEQSEGEVKIEASAATSLGELKPKIDTFSEGVNFSDEIAKEDSEELTLNFKRKGEIAMRIVDEETNTNTENGPNIEIMQKRTKLERNSFIEACTADAAFGKTEESDVILKERKKEVSSRNLRWFLLKSNDSY